MLDRIGDKINSYFKDVSGLTTHGVCVTQQEKMGTYPAVNISGSLRNMITDNHIGSFYSFVRVIDGYSFKDDLFTGDIEVTFFCNMNKEGLTIDTLRTAILTAAQSGFNEYEVNVYENPSNVYSGFTAKAEHRQWNKAPYYVIKITVSNYKTQC